MRRGESIYNQMTEMGADWKGQSRNCRSSAVVLAQTSSGLLKCIFPSTAGIYYNCQSNRVSAVPRGNRARFPVVCRRRQRRTADRRLAYLCLVCRDASAQLAFTRCIYIKVRCNSRTEGQKKGAAPRTCANFRLAHAHTAAEVGHGEGTPH
jgi:hypothetical protein